MPLLESFVSFAVATTTVILETVVQNAFYFRDLVAYYFGGGKKSDEIKLDGGVRLRSYDLLALHYTLWLVGSPSYKHLQRMFDWNLTAKHADIGVATGYWARHSSRLGYLLETQAPKGGQVEYHLFDQNEAFLDYAEYAISKVWHPVHYPLSLESSLVSYLDPETVKAGDRGHYTSCQAMLLLHRVAYPVQKEGNLGAIKAQQLFKLAASLLAPGARFYGVTVLPPEAVAQPTGYCARLRFLRGKAAQDHLRRRGVLHNEHDTVDNVVNGLIAAGFSETSIKIKVVNFVMAWEATLA